MGSRNLLGIWNVFSWIPTTRPSYNPTIFPSKQPSYHPSAIPTLMPTSEPTIKTYCVNLTIFSDIHYEDITWTITGDDTDESGTLSSYFQVYSECVYIVDDCFSFEITDSFGDGLGYGYGNWKIGYEGYQVSSFSNGYYKESESIDICKPSMWENDTEIASVIISIEDSTPVDMINSMKGDLATL